MRPWVWVCLSYLSAVVHLLGKFFLLFSKLSKSHRLPGHLPHDPHAFFLLYQPLVAHKLQPYPCRLNPRHTAFQVFPVSWAALCMQIWLDRSILGSQVNASPSLHRYTALENSWLTNSNGDLNSCSTWKIAKNRWPSMSNRSRHWATTIRFRLFTFEVGILTHVSPGFCQD